MSGLSIIEPKEIQDRMVKHLFNESKLYYCGFDNLEKYYSFMLGNCTDITGYPYSGKTLFLIEVLFNLSLKYGMKHLLHLPDAGKVEEIMEILFNKYTGRAYDRKKHNALKFEEEDNEEYIILQNIPWLNEHFKFLQYGSKPTPQEYWEFACSQNVHTASIDSWNYMKHTGSGTDYLAEVLSYRNELAEEHKKHFFTIIHPKNPSKTDYKGKGILKAPDVYNLMGGSEWNNNGKNIIAIHKESKESLNYDICIRKVKPKRVGKTGIATLQYDDSLHKFCIDNGIDREYSFNEKQDVNF